MLPSESESFPTLDLVPRPPLIDFLLVDLDVFLCEDDEDDVDDDDLDDLD